MEIAALALFVASCSLIIAITAAIFGINAVIDVKALQKSTHTLQTTMQPIDTPAFPAESFDPQEVMASIHEAEDKFNGLRSENYGYDNI